MLFGKSEITLISEETFTFPIALPEKTFTLTAPSASGIEIAPAINPACKRTDNLGATALPIRS